MFILHISLFAFDTFMCLFFKASFNLETVYLNWSIGVLLIFKSRAPSVQLAIEWGLNK
jgi:hypothetical protein